MTDIHCLDIKGEYIRRNSTNNITHRINFTVLRIREKVNRRNWISQTEHLSTITRLGVNEEDQVNKERNGVSEN